MKIRLSRVLFAAALTASGLLSIPVFSAASASTTSASTGYDVSFPQCGRVLPSGAGFGIVGVNDGHPFSTNPCLANELRWAGSTLGGAPSFYLNTGSPGPAYSSSWPKSQQSPSVCSGDNSTACSYDFGWNAARVSFANAVNAETTNGSTSPSATAKSAHWWLDVETGNTWETIEPLYGRTASSQANDQAEIKGSLAYLNQIGVTFVGIYSNNQQWNVITGGTGSTFAAVQVWMPGYANLTAAEAACDLPSFTGGRVAMIQYPSTGLDGDYLCGLTSTPAAAATTVTGSLTFSDQLMVSGNAGTVTYVQTSGTPNLVVSPTGLVSTGATLAPGIYSAKGTSSDPYGDTGTFAFTLTVGLISQGSPTSASVKTSGSSSFSDQLVASGNNGTVTYVQTAGSPNLAVSPAGLVTTNGVQAAGSYTAKGTTSDANGDSGTFAFTLVVGAITQNAPTAFGVDASASLAFTHQIAVSRNNGVVTYVQLNGSPNLLVSTTGLVTTSGALAAGTYVARGTTSDAVGDHGTFVVMLKVAVPGVLAPITAPVAMNVRGHAVAGRTVVMTVVGSGFYGRPLVTSHAGTFAQVVRDSGTSLVLRVTVLKGSRNGVFTFTVFMSNGTSCKVRYNQH